MNKISDMPKKGVWFAKALPPHRGHLSTILQAATQVQQLDVIVSEHEEGNGKLCRNVGIPYMPGAKRVQWLSQELMDMPHITVKLLNENNMPVYPNGWDMWTQELQKVAGEKIDMFFCGKKDIDVYGPKLKSYFPGVKVTAYDTDTCYFNISATEIRSNPIKHWDYILGPARPFFAKKILIAGTESTGKTTLTKTLAKMYHTSWSEEVGRYYATQYLGGNENYFTDEDFTRIAHLQVEQDHQALRNCNRVCFFDTDATATDYFSQLYMGHSNSIVRSYIDPDKYDIVFMLKPDVEWVDDGMRLNGSQEQRIKLHNKLKDMYDNLGFKVVEVGGTYQERLKFILSKIDEMIGGK
jgi:HTH-type transcriptional repressor of NAD biosynthesis genes